MFLHQHKIWHLMCFIYRHVIKKDFEEHKDIVRAKRINYIPVELSRIEIDAIFVNLVYPFDLVAKFLYGCVLRLIECLNFRINNFKFDNCILTFRDGKGQKDHTVPLPEKILVDIDEHLERVKMLHHKDLDVNYDGVFMFNALEKKF